MAGPFLKPGYARGIGGTTNAKLAIENGAIYLTAGKLNGAGNMDLAVSKHDLSGRRNLDPFLALRSGWR